MYQYDDIDRDLVRKRIEQFRWQVKRRLEGSLTEEEFRPLRLMNGLYLQLHAYMLRIAIPYGTLSARQLRKLADIADTYDRGYGHFTTRQNIQFNWPQLSDVPDILEELAEVEMHAIQTSGNCIRNVTSDPLAGVAADEIEDPRPTAELIRQWSSLHPEFSFLPRKFKIAVTGSPNDRTAVYFHDIGIRTVRGPDGAIGYEIIIGGGQGRTPMVGKVARSFLPKADLLPYLEAILRVYNLYGRRDNKFKARIKILVHEVGIERLREQIEAEFARSAGRNRQPDVAALAHIRRAFSAPPYEHLPARSAQFEDARLREPAFAAWCAQNMTRHKVAGYAAVTVTLKKVGGEPGDITSREMRGLADLAERYSFSELRVTHEQNLVLPHVRQDELHALWQELARLKLADANRGLVTDIICCPGLDYCALATARSIPIAQAISRRFADPEKQRETGPLAIKISGCINACGHHHIGHIGILGLNKAGKEYYQLTIGGDPTETPAIGERAGPGLSAEEVPDAVERLINHYLRIRHEGETFLETYRRVGGESFREALHAAH